MTETNSPQRDAPLDAGHLTHDQETRGAAQVRRRACHAVTRDPVPLAAAIAELLTAGDDPFAVRCTWWRMGYAAGEAAHADDYDRGYNDGVVARKRAGIDLYHALELEQRRWELWGEKRTRATFGQPHPLDGKGGAA